MFHGRTIPVARSVSDVASANGQSMNRRESAAEVGWAPMIFLGLCLAMVIVALGEFGILFSLPLFLQSALGYTALGAGSVLATLALGAFIAGPQDRVSQVERVSAGQAAQVADVVEQSAGTATPALAAQSQPIADAASEAFADALRHTAFVAAGFVALGLAATLLLPGAQPDDASHLAQTVPPA